MVSLASTEGAGEGVLRINDPARGGVHFDTSGVGPAFRPVVDNLRRRHHMSRRIRCFAVV
jgi:hypothetical protein